MTNPPRLQSPGQLFGPRPIIPNPVAVPAAPSMPQAPIQAERPADQTQLSPLANRQALQLDLRHQPEGRIVAPGLWLSDSRRSADGGVMRVLTLDPKHVELFPIFKPNQAISAKAMKAEPGLLAAINASFFGPQFLIGDAKRHGTVSQDDHNVPLDRITDQRYFIAVSGEKVVTGRGGLSENQTAAYTHFLGGFPALFTREQSASLERDITSGQFAQRANYGGASPESSISRSFIGLTADGQVLLLAAGHGQARSKGVSMVEGARLMHELGAVEAYILDGGGSTSLYVKGQVDAPTDGRQVWSYLGIRPR